LGRQHRSDFTYCHGRKLSKERPKEHSVLREGYVTTFVASRLVLQILTVRVNPDFHGRIMLSTQPGPWDRGRGLTMVWPATPAVQWPPAWSFRESDLDAFALRFRTEA
jgi:hypothetical protein